MSRFEFHIILVPVRVKEMCLELENLFKNFHLIVLPSTLWSVHLHPQYEFIAIVQINMLSNYKMIIEKGILLTLDNNNYIKATITLNNKTVDMPNINTNINGVSDLSLLLYTLNDIKLCTNSNNLLEFPKCYKYSFNNQHYCVACNNLITPIQLNSQLIPDVDETDQTFSESKLIIDQSSSILDEVFQEPQPYPCELSNKESTHLDTFNGHNNNNKSNNRDKHVDLTNKKDSKCFECELCGKTFSKKYNLKVHERIHSGERPYVCSSCGKTFTSRSNLSTHTMSAHTKTKRHVCQVCGMSFVHPRILRIHMQKHTGEKPFMCSTCGKVFSKNIHLTVHNRTHTGEKPYVCSVCGKGFTTTGNLDSHKRINHKNYFNS